MFLPRSFLPLVKLTRFWTDYFFLTDTPYPSLYKEAFRRAVYDSDDEESGNQDAHHGSDDSDEEDLSGQSLDHEELENLDDPSDDEDSHNQDDTSNHESSTEPPDNHGQDEENHSSSSSSSPQRSRSPLLSYNLVFSFNRDVDPTDDTFNLSISLDPNLSYIPLTFCAPNAYDVTIAHDDQAHWHPFVLKWDELEVVSKAVSITFATGKDGRPAEGRNEAETEMHDMYKHPGLPLLFLYRFAPICQGDDVEKIVGMLVKAYQKVLGEAVKDRDLQKLVERVDCRKRGFRWFREGENWWIGKGEDAETAGGVYTYRSREAVKDRKWMNEEWNVLVEEARAVVQGVVGGGGDGEKEDEYRELGKRFAPREQHGLNVWLALREKDRPMPPRAGRYFGLTLDGVLRILDMGRATSSGGSSCIINGRSVSTSDHMSITIYGDLARGKTVIKQMLWWLRAPMATTLRDGSSYGELPLNLADETEDKPDDIYLGICVPDILPDCSWLVGHTLPDSLRTTLESKEVLGETGEVTRPTADGWLTVTTADGGEVGFNFSRFDDEKLQGTGAIALRRVTAQASALLHRLMEASGAVLTPVRLVAKPLSEKVMEISWPPHRIVDAETIHGILSAGAFDLWKKAEGEADVGDDADSDGEASTPQWI
ncbi:hypothetical protein B0H67DRAFT_580579 [Lasiosphaeris hirsuta]|uniref:Uncharacterized protein n=1 Tax=Lasiosphaeris hirsuta TaxID=260670 RepID=A0AA40DVU3_9PEZI|nr:hypothetical protein B0H67DRAFT_580579 [Lasiosphaeris hirsuta]